MAGKSKAKSEEDLRLEALLVAGGMPPKKDDEDDEDDEDDDEKDDDADEEASESGDAESSEDDSDEGEPDTEALAAAAQACHTASEACSRAVEALDSCASECEGGSDSVATLSAAEAACDEAIEELTEAKAKCSAIRQTGLTAEAPSEEAPPAAAQMAAAAVEPVVTALDTIPTAVGKIAVARAAAYWQDTMKALGESNDARAFGKLSSLLEAQTRIAATSARQTVFAREIAWEEAIRAGSFRAGQVWEPVKNKDGSRGKRFTKFAAGINAKHSDPEQLAGYLEGCPKLSTNEIKADSSFAISDSEMQQRASIRPKTAELISKINATPEKLAALEAVLFNGVNS